MGKGNKTNDVIYKIHNCYFVSDKNGKILSSLEFYDYHLENFDWILLYNLATKPRYRNLGYASKLVNTLYEDICNSDQLKGLYLFVDINNYEAIKLYLNLGFEKIKKYIIDENENIIMAKGKADKKQIEDMQFD